MSQTESETITEALEMVAERAGDITGAVFDRYFERCSDSKALMEHTDEYMRGRMMEQVLLLLMEPGESELESYLEFETTNHRAYGVEQYMYERLMSAVTDVVAKALGDDYSPDMQSAFAARTGFLLKEIAAADAH